MCFQYETVEGCLFAGWRASDAWSKLNVSNFHRTKNMQIFNLGRKFDLHFFGQKKWTANILSRISELNYAY